MKGDRAWLTSPLGSGGRAPGHRDIDPVATGEVPQAIASVPPGPARGLVANVARESFIHGLNELFVIAAIVAFVGAASALVLVRSRDFVGDAAPRSHGPGPRRGG